MCTGCNNSVSLSTEGHLQSRGLMKMNEGWDYVEG